MIENTFDAQKPRIAFCDRLKMIKINGIFTSYCLTAAYDSNYWREDRPMSPFLLQGICIYWFRPVRNSKFFALIIIIFTKLILDVDNDIQFVSDH